MAAKKAKQAPAAEAAAQPEQLTATAALQMSDSTAVFYVNNVEVGHTAYDFSLTCAKIPAKFSQMELDRIRATSQVELEAVVQIVVPVSLVPGLIRALTVQKEVFEQAYGQIYDVSLSGKAKREH